MGKDGEIVALQYSTMTWQNRIKLWWWSWSTRESKKHGITIVHYRGTGTQFIQYVECLCLYNPCIVSSWPQDHFTTARFCFVAIAHIHNNRHDKRKPNQRRWSIQCRGPFLFFSFLLLPTWRHDPSFMPIITHDPNHLTTSRYTTTKEKRVQWYCPRGRDTTFPSGYDSLGSIMAFHDI